MELHAQPPWCSLMCVAPSTGCVLNSVHVVPLLTRSCRWSNSWLGPVAGGSGLAQDSLRRVVATVWRFCGTASRLLYSPLKATFPTLSRLGSFSVADGAGGCWVGRTHPPPPRPPPTWSLVVLYLWRPDSDSRLRSFLKGLTLHWFRFAIWTSGSLLISPWVWNGK